MSEARDRTHEPRPHDAYMTIDPRPIPALLKHVTLRGEVWEPACGTGEMVKRLAAGGYGVRPTDLNDYQISFGRLDFLQADRLINPAIGSIVTNPPNKLNRAFALKALELLEPVRGLLALYQRHEWDTTQRAAPLFDHPAYAVKVTCRFRPGWIDKAEVERREKASGKSISPFHKWSWYVWDWTHSGPPIVRFA